MWLPDFHGQALHEDRDEEDAEGEEDDDDENGDDDESTEGAWDSAISQTEAAGYAHEGYPILAPTLAGGGDWPPEEEGEWSLHFDSVAAWISDAVYTRVKAWCGEYSAWLG